MHWAKWKEVLAAKEDGGLGFGSLEAMNLALLYRWRWRALANPHCLWVRGIMAIHGRECFSSPMASNNGLWSNIVKAIKEVHAIPVTKGELVKRQVGNGRLTFFWSDKWKGCDSLAVAFPRLFALETNKECTIHDRRENGQWKWEWRRTIRNGLESEQFAKLMNHLPPDFDVNSEDKWKWSLNGVPDLIISHLRFHIDKHRLTVATSRHVEWNKLVPKKVNIFVWRLMRDAIPNFMNLFARGIDVVTIRCLQCDNGIETSRHIFKNCELVEDTRKLISEWLKLGIPSREPAEIMDWIHSKNLPSRVARIVNAVLYNWWWHLWKARNNVIHDSKRESAKEVFMSIVTSSYLWAVNRDKKVLITWLDWLDNPCSL